MPSYVDLTFAKKILMETGTTDDGTFHLFFASASQLVEDWCGQNFDERVASYAFSSEIGTYNPILFLRHRPLLTLTSLTNGNGDAIASTIYTLLPKFLYPKEGVRLTAGNVWRGPNDPVGSTDCSTQSAMLALAGYAVDAIELVGTWGYVPHYAQAWKATGLTISGAHTSSDDTILLSAAAGTLLDVGKVIRATVGTNVEQMRISGPTASFSAATTITVERGYNGTTANTYAGGEAITVFQVAEIPKLATAFVACALYVSRNNATGDTVDVGGFSFRMNPGLWGKARQILVPPYHNYYYGRAYG